MRMVGVSKSFGSTNVLQGYCAQFPTCGIVGVSGASGSGKSTLLRMIAGLESPDAGRIEDVPECVSVQFEDDRLFPWMDVLANIALAGCDGARAMALLDELGLKDKAHARIGSLSGGQRRRIALARALAYPASLYVLDEPTARLDGESAKMVLGVLRRYCANSLMVVATHDQQVLKCCDVVLDSSDFIT